MNMNNPEFITYTDQEGFRLIYRLPGTRIFGDGTYHCPQGGHRPMPPHHRKALAWYIKNARQKHYEGDLHR
jgi:hypothetical protein